LGKEKKAGKATTAATPAVPAPNCICPRCRTPHYRDNSHKWRYCKACEGQKALLSGDALFDDMSCSISPDAWR